MILLTLTMIVGVITIVWVIVTRMPQAMQRPPALPDSITLPDGAPYTLSEPSLDLTLLEVTLPAELHLS